MSAKVLIAASTKTKANEIKEILNVIPGGIDVVTGSQKPKQWDSYRLFVCEIGPRLRSPEALLAKLNPHTHVVLILPQLNVATVAQYMTDTRINHFLSSSFQPEELRLVAEKLSTGDIFGLDWYLPDDADITYKRFTSYQSRLKVLEELNTALEQAKLRGQIRRAAGQVAEELLMNAMYQAPIGRDGKRVFADIDPNERLRKKSPRPVSMRYAIFNKSVYLSVRDRYGSFQRDDMARYLYRCVTSEMQIERKKLGAGLGLYLISSIVNQLIVNVLPGGVTEFICIVTPPPKTGDRLRLFSFTTQRPLSVS